MVDATARVDLERARTRAAEALERRQQADALAGEVGRLARQLEAEYMAAIQARRLADERAGE